MSKKALITGVSGQDGSYLAKHLLSHGYQVFGAGRRSASDSSWRHRELGIQKDINYLPFELLEYSNILSVIDKIQPDEIYNLAAQSFVATSFDQPLYTSNVDAIGVLHILEAVRTVNPKIRFYQASSSEMYGKVQTIPQTENTPFYPRSPYATAKLYAHWITVNYRESYGMHATSGILFNHESPLRGEEFVTRKITLGLARIKLGLQSHLELGNIEAKRDWGYAKDFVEGMHLMLQQETADDYVLATNETHTVREFIMLAAQIAGFDIAWEGSGVNEVGIDKKTNKTIIKINPAFYRPNEVDLLIGSPEKAKAQLGWTRKISFLDLVTLMMEADLTRTRRLANQTEKLHIE